VSATTTCDNPMCSCDPCGCDDCSCGTARLGDLERRVMEILWSRPDRELSVRDVADVLTDYAYTTVATVLDRLVHKGLVQRRMDGRTIQFTGVGTPGAHTAVLMHEALAVDRDTDAALLRFAETLSPSEAAVLRRGLNALERKARKTDR
jgi:predicted transcriptional regulator